MDIYKTNNKNIFYAFLKIDNKEIELDFVLTVKNHFYCDIFIKNKEDIKRGTYTTIQQYNFHNHNFIVSLKELNKYLTDRQIDLTKKGIKKAYKKILAIKFEEIIGHEKNMSIYENKLTEYEEYRKYIDVM